MTAEVVAERYGISRTAQDAVAAESQQRAAAAIRDGTFADEIVPVEGLGAAGKTVHVEADEHPRPDPTADTLSSLAAAFTTGGSVTAGNSCGINDGASALAIVSSAQGAARPLARIITPAVAGEDPSCMGIGPVPAARKCSHAPDSRSTRWISSS